MDLSKRSRVLYPQFTSTARAQYLRFDWWFRSPCPRCFRSHFRLQEVTVSAFLSVAAVCRAWSVESVEPGQGWGFPRRLPPHSPLYYPGSPASRAPITAPTTSTKINRLNQPLHIGKVGRVWDNGPACTCEN